MLKEREQMIEDAMKYLVCCNRLRAGLSSEATIKRLKEHHENGEHLARNCSREVKESFLSALRFSNCKYTVSHHLTAACVKPVPELLEIYKKIEPEEGFADEFERKATARIAKRHRERMEKVKPTGEMEFFKEILLDAMKFIVCHMQLKEGLSREEAMKKIRDTHAAEMTKCSDLKFRGTLRKAFKKLIRSASDPDAVLTGVLDVFSSIRLVERWGTPRIYHWGLGVEFSDVIDVYSKIQPEEGFVEKYKQKDIPKYAYQANHIHISDWFGHLFKYKQHGEMKFGSELTTKENEK